MPGAASIAFDYPVRICFLAGASLGSLPVYERAARSCVAAVAQHGACLVYGGGSSGLMGAVADEAARLGVPTIGVFPRSLALRDQPASGLSEIHVVDSLHARKALMASLSNVVVALPGGLGTLEEFIEALTWCDLGLQDKPCGLLNVEAYYDHLLAYLNSASASGFIGAAGVAHVVSETTPAVLIDRLVASVASS